jgi:hypothetical protein
MESGDSMKEEVEISELEVHPHFCFHCGSYHDPRILCYPIDSDLRSAARIQVVNYPMAQDDFANRKISA